LIFKLSKTDGAPNSVSMLLPFPRRGPLFSRILLHFQSQVLLPCTKTILLAEIQILRNPIVRIKIFGQLNLIVCVVAKLTVNERFWVSPIGTYHSVNYVHKSVTALGFTQKHRATKLPSTWQLMDVLSRLMLLNALTALILFAVSPSYVINSRKSPFLNDWPIGIYLIVACSGFEPESPVHFMDFNIKRPVTLPQTVNIYKIWFSWFSETFLHL
jgi:hypothetical protein